MPPVAPPAHQAADRAGRLLAMLQRLAEIGMQLAERAAAQALAEPPSPAECAPKSGRRGPDPSYVFLRLSRFVRDTVALEARLAAGELPRAPRKTSHPAAGTQDVPEPAKGVRRTTPQPRPANPGHPADASLSHSLGLARDAAKLDANIREQPIHLVREFERLAADAMEGHHARFVLP